MAKTTRKGFFDPARFTGGIQQLLDSLPSEYQKRELESKLNQLIDFVTELKTRLARVPSREDVESVRMAIAEIENILADTSSNAIVRTAMGLPPAKTAKKLSPVTPEEHARAEMLVKQLEALPIDRMRTALADERRYSIRDLYAIAKNMGMRLNPKTGRETLLHQIATRISNFRGYQDLGGGTTKFAEPQEQPTELDTDPDKASKL